MIGADTVYSDRCDVCHEGEAIWALYGVIQTMCVVCHLEHLKEKTRCTDCTKKAALGDLCYDGWGRYEYRSPECMQAYLGELTELQLHNLYSEYEIASSKSKSGTPIAKTKAITKAVDSRSSWMHPIVATTHT